MESEEQMDLDQRLQNSIPPISWKEWVDFFQFSFFQKITCLCLVLLMVGFFVFDVLFPNFSLSSKKQVLVQEKKDALSFHVYKTKRPALEEILNTVRSRSLFLVQERFVLKKPVEGNASGIEEKLAPFVLLGVMEDQPIQAIIESKTSGQTFYVQEGDLFFDLEVMSISAGQVTFRHGDQTRVLR